MVAGSTGTTRFVPEPDALEDDHYPSSLDSVQVLPRGSHYTLTI